MIAEDLKQKVDSLTSDERKELSFYLIKRDLESDEDYWNTVRKNSQCKDPSSWVDADKL